jgi:general secretion pathway protein K
VQAACEALDDEARTCRSLHSSPNGEGGDAGGAGWGVRGAWIDLMRGRKRESGERGFTFLVVMWALSILMVLSLVFGAAISGHVKTTRNAIDNARAEALADAGVELSVLDLTAWRDRTVREARFPRDGRPVRCSLGNGDWLTIAVEDEVGKVDLNAADERLIVAALLAAGMAEGEAAAHAQRILDYRDGDDARRPDGAETAEYRDAGRPGPKNRPFDTIEEVEQVLGAAPGLAEALRPYATVYSAQVTIDANLASGRLVAALSDGLAAQSAFDAAGSTLGTLSQGMGGMSQQRGSTQATGAGGRAFRVVSQARTAQGAVFVREALVEFVANQPGAYLFRRWRKGSSDSRLVEEALPVSDLPPC